MVYIAYKTVFSAAAIALLALTHVLAAPAKDSITLEEIKEIGEDFMAAMYEPSMALHRCNAQCYTNSLRDVLGRKFKEDADAVDSCVKKLLARMRNMEDIHDLYERKKWVIHWNMGQFCADVLESKGQVPFFDLWKVPKIQGQALACSGQQCAKPYDAAFAEAMKTAGTKVEAAMED